jgi:peptide deformylase
MNFFFFLFSNRWIDKSVPNFYAKVERFNHIVVEALDENGEPFTLEARNLLAVCIQHE